jgi:organic radical activating enzyme
MKRERDKPGQPLLRVKEVFPTIQGEGPLAGEPCVFLRLEGCNLRCWFCDTDFDHGEGYDLPRLVAELEAACPPAPYGKRRLCVITGGEPMMQDIGPLIGTLLGGKWAVQIETAGTVYCELPKSPYLDVVCSPKTPKIHPRVRQRVTAWKYLIRCGDKYNLEDGLPISQTQSKGRAGDQNPASLPMAELCKPTPHVPVFLQPVEEPDGVDSQANISETVRRTMAYGYRLCLQQHKILGLR